MDEQPKAIGPANPPQADARGFSTMTLKIVAIACMVVDHVPYVMPDALALYYLPPYWIMHAIGRITAPIFFYLVGVGYFRTRNATRYTIRLLVFAALSYIPYIAYFKAPDGAKTLGAVITPENFLDLNVIFTMLFGLLLLRSLHEIKNVPLKLLAAAGCLIGGAFSDYGLFGMAMIIGFAYTLGNRRVLAAVFCGILMVDLYTAFLGDWADAFPATLMAVAGDSANFAFSPRHAYMIVLACQFLPLFFIQKHRDPMKVREARPSPAGKWLFYIFYPAHITALLFVKLYMFS
ncbi:MAG: conjugal transfer protein TraX [Clostridiales Family XIII bacterium]|jgi:hypothetical protein|nr:conjugal transfer protein TraX [Clostridiales Family XIII bacterium]